MANLKSVKQAPINVELGDKVRTIQFDMNAYAVLEDRYGSVDAAMSQLEKGRMKDLGIMLWAGLIHEEVTSFDEETGEPTGYNITPYQVRSWIKSPAEFEEIGKKLSDALAANLPEVNEEEVKNK